MVNECNDECKSNIYSPLAPFWCPPTPEAKTSTPLPADGSTGSGVFMTPFSQRSQNKEPKDSNIVTLTLLKDGYRESS